MSSIRLTILSLLLIFSCNTVAKAQDLFRLPPVLEESTDLSQLQESVYTAGSTYPQEPVQYLAPVVQKYQPANAELYQPSLPELPLPEQFALPEEPTENIVEKEIVSEVTEEEELDSSDYGYFESVPYDEYFHADYWCGPAKWNNSLEFGLNGQTGNSESVNFRVGAKVKREGESTTFLADIKHARANSSNVQTQNNALFNAKIEWPLKDRRWHLFFKNGLEYDEFKDFDLRLSLSGGLGYKWIKTDRTDLTFSFGSGISREFGAPDNRIVPEGVLGVELDHKLTEKQSLDMKMEHFPDWTGLGEFRNVTDIGYNIMLDDHLSLKLGIVNRYDSTPYDRQRNDLDYALLLLWKN